MSRRVAFRHMLFTHWVYLAAATQLVSNTRLREPPVSEALEEPSKHLGSRSHLPQWVPSGPIAQLFRHAHGKPPRPAPDSQIPRPLKFGTVIDRTFNVDSRSLRAAVLAPGAPCNERFFSLCGRSELLQGEWKSRRASRRGTLSCERVVTFRSPQPVATSPSCYVTETQRLTASGDGHGLSVVEIRASATGVALADTFVTECLVCFVPMPAAADGTPTTRLIASWAIRWLDEPRANPWLRAGITAGVRNKLQSDMRLYEQAVAEWAGERPAPDAAAEARISVLPAWRRRPVRTIAAVGAAGVVARRLWGRCHEADERATCRQPDRPSSIDLD